MANEPSARNSIRWCSRGLVLLLIVSAYFGTYYAWAERAILLDPTPDGYAQPHFLIRQELQLQTCDDGSIFPASRERAVQPMLRVFFKPAHWLDCRLRPQIWR